MKGYMSKVWCVLEWFIGLFNLSQNTDVPINYVSQSYGRFGPTSLLHCALYRIKKDDNSYRLLNCVGI